MSTEDLTIVIRSAGERTVGLCRNLVLRQCDCPVEIVDERPFETALRSSYEIGIRHRAPWTLMLDADILLHNGVVSVLLAAAENMPPHYFQIQGRIYDKITGLYRTAGPRVYRTSLLAKAIRLIPPPGQQIRPETFVIKRMQALNYSSRRIGLVTGLHDYEQYYRDLYRKALVHAHKHTDLVPEITRRADELKGEDPEFLIILRGLQDGLLDPGPVKLDTRLFPKELTMILREFGIEERGKLSEDGIGFREIERLQETAGPAPEDIGGDDVVGGLVEADTMVLDLGEQLNFPLIAFGRETGDVDGGAIKCVPTKHSPGHCLFGCDFTIAEAGHYCASFALTQMDEADGGGDVVLDIYENNVTRRVLAEAQVDSAHWKSCEVNWVLLEFFAERGYRVEFRIYWGGGKLLRIHGVRLERVS